MFLRQLVRWGGAGLLLLSVMSCTPPGRTAVLGYVYDITTAKPMTSFQMEIDSPEIGSQTTSPDGNGMFQFTIKSDSDYIIRITQDGYRTFTSTNLRGVAPGGDPAVPSDDLVHRRVYMAAMIPTTVSQAGLTGNVVDIGSGAPVDGGFFRLVPIGVPLSFQQQIYAGGLEVGGTAVNIPRFWMPDTSAVAGPISKGSFTIPKDSLLPGYTYQLATVGVPGYQDFTTAFPAFSTAVATPQINIKLTKLVIPGPVTLVAQSNLGPDLNPTPIGANRAIVFTFDRPITMDSKGLKGAGFGSNNLLTIVKATDASGVATALTLKTETPAAGAFSQNVTVAATGNTVTITLAAETALVNQTVDPNGDLIYSLSVANLLTNILVRDAAWAGGSFLPLSGFVAPPKNTVVIRHNFAP